MNFMKCPKCSSINVILNVLYEVLDEPPYKCLTCGYGLDTKDEKESKLHLSSLYGTMLSKERRDNPMQDIISVYTFVKRYLVSSQKIVVLDAELDYVYFKGRARDVKDIDAFKLRLLRVEPDATGIFKDYLLLLV